MRSAEIAQMQFERARVARVTRNIGDGGITAGFIAIAALVFGAGATATAVGTAAAVISWATTVAALATAGINNAKDLYNEYLEQSTTEAQTAAQFDIATFRPELAVADEAYVRWLMAELKRVNGRAGEILALRLYDYWLAHFASAARTAAAAAAFKSEWDRNVAAEELEKARRTAAAKVQKALDLRRLVVAAPKGGSRVLEYGITGRADAPSEPPVQSAGASSSAPAAPMTTNTKIAIATGGVGAALALWWWLK